MVFWEHCSSVCVVIKICWAVKMPSMAYKFISNCYIFKNILYIKYLFEHSLTVLYNAALKNYKLCRW